MYVTDNGLEKLAPSNLFEARHRKRRTYKSAWGTKESQPT